MATAACKLMVNLSYHQTEIFDACEFGDLESVIEIHKKGIDPNNPASPLERREAVTLGIQVGA